MAFSSIASVLLLIGSVLARNLAPAPHELFVRDDVDPTLLYPEYNISIPIDHFHSDSQYEPHSNGYFNNRYWFDATYYKKGGPVIVLQSGETDASGRLVYLQKGLLHQLAKATHGIGVVFEHRYYGTSFPTPNLSTKNLRFLTTDQALADQTYFAHHVKFAGLEHLNLTASKTAYLAYGGSYAGGFVAFLRKLYPDTWWGTISSSGVTYALWDYWQYYEPLRVYAPQDCMSIQQKLINVADNIMLGDNPSTKAKLKKAFGMQDLTHNDDFMNVLSYALGYWQNRNWDPEVNDPTFYEYCGNITSSSVLWPQTASLASGASSLISAGGWSKERSTLTNPMLNFIGFVNATFLGDYCAGQTLDECWGTHNASSSIYADKSLSNFNSLSWAYQYCSEWGYLQTGSGVPATRLPLISRLLTLEYLSEVCRFAFNRSEPANVTAINKYGGLNISYPRLALIGGQTDPWRPVTPLASPNGDTINASTPDALNRTSTTSEPKILIKGAVHHWDENGLFPNETTAKLPPPPVRNAQTEIAQFVAEWMTEWEQQQHHQ